ncbi:uncharacterized protein CEXT_72571 [Caerostris extrusa]|uniref:Gustatory receptor n=1 Tax=Caerostris extrusa TaxID=172846 RepID=A0AAV4XRU7_CAEEX|nr:uncharacterized protein CEXT_72571 [Caerostris extrusa]
MDEELFQVRSIHLRDGHYPPKLNIPIRLNGYGSLWKMLSLFGVDVTKTPNDRSSPDSISALYYNCKYLLVQYNIKLDGIDNAAMNQGVITSYLTLYKVIEDVYNVLRTPTVLCSCCFVLHLSTPSYLILCRAVPNLDGLYSPSKVVSVPDLISFLSCTLIALISAACIPIIMQEIHQQMNKITISFTRIQENTVCNFSSDYRTVEILKVVLQKKPIKISFCERWRNHSFVILVTFAIVLYSIKFIFNIDDSLKEPTIYQMHKI